jgi:glycosyltransferase involved in cell wall biosynthesis
MISVIIPHFNDYINLQHTLESIKAINIQDIHVIVKDTNSLSGSQVRSLKTRYGKIFFLKILIKSDRSIYDGMNQAMLEVQTEYCIFLGAGDEIVLNSEEFMRIGSIIKEVKPDLIYGNVILKSDGRIYDKEFSRYKLAYKNICHQACFYKSNFLKKRPFKLYYNVLADYEQNLHLFGQGTIHYVPSNISRYDDMMGYSKTHIDNNFLKNHTKIVMRHLGIFPYLILVIRNMLRKVYRVIVKSDI